MAENIFANLRVYGAGQWKQKSSRKLNDTEKSQIVSAEVTQSDFENGPALSVCFTMVSGGKVYMPTHKDYMKHPVGTKLNVDDLSIVTLGKQGEADITRVNCD